MKIRIIQQLREPTFWSWYKQKADVSQYTIKMLKKSADTWEIPSKTVTKNFIKGYMELRETGLNEEQLEEYFLTEE